MRHPDGQPAQHIRHRNPHPPDARPPAPADAASAPADAASAPLTRKQNTQMNRWLNQIELQPAILPPLATNRHPKNFPALAGFYEKP